MLKPWTFASSIGRDRIERLTSASSFAELLADVVRSAEVLCVHIDCCHDRAGYSRVVVTVRVSRDTFDLLFNSQAGYRGAFAQAPHIGLAANDQALQAMFPLVLAQNETSAARLDSAFLRESLGSTSAKLWLAEVGLDLCKLCEGEWSKPNDLAPEIFNGIWEANEGVEDSWGRKAPFLTKLKLIGAFLDDRHNEYVPLRKQGRADQIYRCGWA